MKSPLFIALCIFVIVTITTAITITPTTPGPFVENTPIIFTVTLDQNFELDQKVEITSSTVFATPTSCFWYTAPTPFDLIIDPSDSYRGYGNCFNSDDDINGDDAVATLTQIYDNIDCTTTEPKVVLTFIANKSINSGTKLRCLGRIISDPSDDVIVARVPREIAFTDTTVIASAINITPHSTEFSIESVSEYAGANNERVVLTTLKIQMTTAQSLPQVLNLKAIAEYTPSTQPAAYKYSSNLFYNLATTGAYTTKDGANVQIDDWSHLCFEQKTQLNSVLNGDAPARLYVSEYQKKPLSDSPLPITLKSFGFGEGITTLLVQPNKTTFYCTLPMSIPSQPADTIAKPYTPITFTLGTTSVFYPLPYKILPVASPPSTGLFELATAPFFDSYTTYTIPPSNASISYIFNLYIDYPLYPPSYYEQTPPPAPTQFKYIVKPNGVNGESTTLETALGLLFPEGDAPVIWSIITTTTDMSTLTWDKTNKWFVVEYTGTGFPTKTEHLQVQVRFQTISFTPPINQNSAQTSFDLLFDVFNFSTQTDVKINSHPLQYRIQPAFLVHELVNYARPAFAPIRFTIRFRAIGYPAAQYGIYDSSKPEGTYPQLRCWIESTDDVTPPKGGKKSRITLSMSVSHQESVDPKSNFYVSDKERRQDEITQHYADYFFRNDQGLKYAFGGKLQLTTLDGRIPVNAEGVFPYTESVFKIGCGFPGMQPVIADFDQYSKTEPNVASGARVAYAMSTPVSYLSLYTSPTRFTAYTSPLMIRITSEHEIKSQWDLEIVQSGAFELLKQGVSSANPDYERFFDRLTWYNLRYFIPRTSVTQLSAQGSMLLGTPRDKAVSSVEKILLPQTQSFSNAPRFHIKETSSSTTTGLDDKAVYTTNTAQDIRSQVGSTLHLVIHNYYIQNWFPVAAAEAAEFAASFKFPSLGKDWSNKKIRVELIAYDPQSDPDNLGGFPVHQNCDVMYHLDDVNGVGYKYPGMNPTCTTRAVGQPCAHHHQCAGGYCDVNTYTCIRNLKPLTVLANSTNPDPMGSIYAAQPMSNAFTYSFGVMITIMAATIMILV